MKEDIEKEKKELVEELGVQLENDKLAPVAARIFATLILAGKQGITFDQLVLDLNASKSTVSTNLEHLQATNRAMYFTKPGDRKRYFVINEDLKSNLIDEMVSKWEADRKIHEKVLEFKKKHNESIDDEGALAFDLQFQEDFLTYLNEATAAIKKLKCKFDQRNTK